MSLQVGIFFVDLKPGGAFTLPPARGGRGVNRVAYYVEGSSLSVGGKAVPGHCALTLVADKPAVLASPATAAENVQV
jgi:hypothetical protein